MPGAMGKVWGGPGGGRKAHPVGDEATTWLQPALHSYNLFCRLNVLEADLKKCSAA